MWIRNLSLAPREEHRLRVFENRVLREILGPKGDEVTGDWRKLACTLKLNTDRVLRSNRIRRAGHVAVVGEITNAYKILVG